MAEVSIEVRTRLAAEPAEVWKHVSTMAGVNAELAPLRMSHPEGMDELGGRDVPLGAPLFTSTISLGRIPVDRHHLTLVALDAPHGFSEDSTSLLHRRWRHDRRLVATDTGCEVVDRIRAIPRVPGTAALTRVVVQRVFARRHRVLAARFGRR